MFEIVWSQTQLFSKKFKKRKFRFGTTSFFEKAYPEVKKMLGKKTLEAI
jgi:hypothetical protein